MKDYFIYFDGGGSGAGAHTKECKVTFGGRVKEYGVKLGEKLFDADLFIRSLLFRQKLSGSGSLALRARLARIGLKKLVSGQSVLALSHRVHSKMVHMRKKARILEGTGVHFQASAHLIAKGKPEKNETRLLSKVSADVMRYRKLGEMDPGSLSAYDDMALGDVYYKNDGGEKGR